jgi:hypothetical protein
LNNALVSGGIGVASGSVAALIQWIFTSYGHPVPAEVLPILTGALVYAGHIAKGYLEAKYGVTVPATPAAPQ